MMRNEELRLLTKRVPQVLVELGEQLRIRSHSLHFAELQPLRREIADERVRALVSQHAPHLPLQDGGLFQLAVRRDIEQFIVGDAAPEEERQPRGQFDIAYAKRAS